MHFYVYQGFDPFQDQFRIYRQRKISKYLIPEQNFMNLLQEKLPSSLTGMNEQDQVCNKTNLWYLIKFQVAFLENFIKQYIKNANNSCFKKSYISWN